MQIKLTFFKESGKYYSEETVDIPDNLTEIFRIADWLETNVKSPKGMHLVTMMGEYANGHPVMIPANRRR